jgi:hypothetical protein
VFVDAVSAFSTVARHVVVGSNRLVRSTTRAGRPGTTRGRPAPGCWSAAWAVIALPSVTCRVAPSITKPHSFQTETGTARRPGDAGSPPGTRRRERQTFDNIRLAGYGGKT